MSQELPGPKDVEYGFCVCKKPNGELVKGPEATGHRYGVQVDVECPPGSTPISLYHTHPGGVAEPSSADIREARRFNLKSLCIGIPETGEIKCHKVSHVSLIKR